MNEIDRVNELNRIRKLNENYAATPDFGTGELLARPEDTSIQGASEDFMDYLQNPTQGIAQPKPTSNPFAMEDFDAMAEQDALDKSLEAPISNAPQTMDKSSSKSSNIGFKSSATPPVTIPQEDILSQLKAARAANEAAMLTARQADSSTDLGNTLMRSGSKLAEAIANRSGNTKIKLEADQAAAKEVDFAGAANKSRLDALMQDYGIKKGLEDTAYNRQKDTDARTDRLADSKFDRDYKNRMLKATEAKSKSDKLTQDSVGQKELDKKFAVDYNKFTSNGFVNATKGIEKLKSQRNMIEKESKERFGTGAGGGSFWASLPDSMRDNESIKMRDITVTLANNALKDTFGGQLSDKEREAKANEFYNDKLSPEDNLEILDTKLAELEDGLAVQRQKAEYFQKNNKSLKGFESNFSLDEGKKSPQQSTKSSPTTGQIISSGGKRYKVINDNGDLEEVK
jgi:hypothetical protein